MNNQNQSQYAPNNHPKNQVPNQSYPQTHGTNQNQGRSQLIDKGRVVVAVDKYPETNNGQPVFIPGTQMPKLKNKWMTIGEATKWQHPEGNITVSEKIYLQPVNCQNAYFEQKTFWDSESQQNGQGQGNYRG